jgi:hypothetical protein
MNLFCLYYVQQWADTFISILLSGNEANTKAKQHWLFMIVIFKFLPKSDIFSIVFH